MVCLDCGGSTAWDDSVGSDICTECGTLVDASQTVLASHLDTQDTSGRDYSSFWNRPNAFSTIIRGGSGRDLAGQSKQARDARNTDAIHTLIKSLGTSLSVSGLTERTMAVFHLIMERCHYQWGRRAGLAAGAALAIALREMRRPDRLYDISCLLQEDVTVLNGVYRSAISALGLKLGSTEPSVHIPILAAHLHNLVHSSESAVLPRPVIELLNSIRMPSVSQTGSALSDLFSRLPPHALTDLPTPPTSCALLILAIESELRSPLPNIAVLSAALGSRLNVSRSTVEKRYKIAQDLVTECLSEVPWLSSDSKRRKKDSKAVRGSGQRATVAKGIKDVLSFSEEILRRKEALHSLTLPPEDNVRNHVDIMYKGDEDLKVFIGSPYETYADRRTNKKRKVTKVMDEASRFLLNPLHATITSVAVSRQASGSPTPTSISPFSASEAQPPASPHSSRAPLPLASYLLTTSPTSSRKAPTRLQLLSSAHGGEMGVEDEDLFAPGELEGMMREEGDRTVLWNLVGHEWEEEEKDREQRRKRRKGFSFADGTEDPVEKKGRVNKDVLARFLGSGVDLDSDDDEDGANMMNLSTNTGAGEEVNDWYPPSPGGFGAWDDTYDEEF